MTTPITIHGTGFKGLGFEQGPSSVHVGPTNGPTNVTSLVVVSDSIMTCTLPPKDPAWGEKVRLWVTTPNGVGSRAAAFHYIPPAPLSITSIAPTSGHYAGGTSVVIRGKKLTTTARLEFDLFGDVSVFPSFVVNSDEQITAITPGGTQYAPYGLRVVLAATPEFPAGEVFEFHVNDAFPAWRYSGDPVIEVDYITPTEGSWLGGYTCTLKGRGFVDIGLLDVSINALSSIIFTVVDDETATFVMPAAPSVFCSPYTTLGADPMGQIMIWCYQNGGAPITSAAFQLQPLRILDCVPNASSVSGGAVIHLYGTSMDTITAVHVHDDNNVIDHNVTASLVIVSQNEATFVFPAMAANAFGARIQLVGTVDVNSGLAEGDGDPSWAPFESYWRFDMGVSPGAEPPAPIAIVPNQGIPAGAVHVVVEVADSTDITAVQVGGVDCTGFAIDDATHVSGDTPATGAPVGYFDNVNVVNAYGQSAPLLAAYEYI